MVKQWARWRDRVTFDIALVFGTLGLLIITERTVRAAGFEPWWLRPLGITVLLAHPFLLLRVVADFRPISRTIQRVAIVGLLISLGAVWIPARPFRAPVTGGLAFGYFIWLLAYVALAFRRGALAAGGVTHWRLLHAGWGALLLAIVFAFAVVMGIVPATRNVLGAFVPLTAIGAALNYYFAFAPPPWVRRVWQSSEMYGLLAEQTSAASTASPDDTLARLCSFVMSAVGATGAAAALEDPVFAPGILHPSDGARTLALAAASASFKPTACDRPRGATFAAARPCAAPGTTDATPDRLARRLATH